jgi:hypothetical protein
VVAESRNVRAYPIGHLHDHLTRARLDRLAVNFNIYDVVSHGESGGSLVEAVNDTASVVANHVFEFVVEML